MRAEMVELQGRLPTSLDALRDAHTSSQNPGRWRAIMGTTALAALPMSSIPVLPIMVCLSCCMEGCLLNSQAHARGREGAGALQWI
jgi:hypothetical protein